MEENKQAAGDGSGQKDGGRTNEAILGGGIGAGLGFIVSPFALKGSNSDPLYAALVGALAGVAFGFLWRRIPRLMTINTLKSLLALAGSRAHSASGNSANRRKRHKSTLTHSKSK